MNDIKFDKRGLVPAIIQDYNTNKVLMLGYMNQDSIAKTLEINRVTFFSRSKNRLWTKGETSGNFLQFVEMKNDCDKDTLLIKVIPKGEVCHTGSDTCWGEGNEGEYAFVSDLEKIIKDRKDNFDKDSYVSSLFEKGVNKIAQKVGEEAVEVVIEAKDNDDDLFLNESADLFFHYLILLREKGFQMSDVIEVLKKRNK